MEWGVNYTNEFEVWWDGLDAEEQEDIDAKVILLQRVGPSLGRPHADTIRQSKHNNMKELIIQHGGDPYRVYEKFVPIADDLFDQHLRSLEKEEKGDG